MLNLSSCSFSSLLVLFLLTFNRPAAAQAPAWQSARAVAVATAAVNAFSAVAATAIDATGNVYLAGNFRNTVVLGGTTLTSRGDYDVFVAKFSPASNQFVWAQRAGGTGGDGASALVVSGNSVYVAGFFTSIADFGSVTLANAGNSDVFVAKLMDAGNTSSFVWAQRAGDTGTDYATALAVSGASVYVTGGFGSPTVSFGPATLTNADATAGSYDVFVAKLTDAGSTGSFVWAQRAGGSDYDAANALAVSGTSVYLTGYFINTAAFGVTSLTSAGSNDIFIAKLTDAGSTSSFVWAQRAGGTGQDQANALAVSSSSVYLTGYFINTAAFGVTSLTSAGGNDLYVAKLTDAGSTSSFAWAQRAGGMDADAATSIFVSGTSVCVTGYFTSTSAFGITSLTSSGGNDVFVAKLTDAGSTSSFTWAQRAGGTAQDRANALAVSNGSVYIVGAIGAPTATFGTITLTNPNPNTGLGFLASLTDPTLTATTAPAGPRELAALFPNPAQHTATLRLPVGTAPAPLTLTDALGRIVRRYPAPAGPEAALDLGGVPAGLYLLRGAGPAMRLAVE